MIGQTLGQYQIIEQIGQGGMATVYKAYQPSLDRHVALKLLPPIYAQQPDFSERFRREAKTIANLNHPHILPVFDFGQEGEYSFLTMRYVEKAHTLKQVMNEALKLAHVSDLMTQISVALDAAHQQGIVHRDVKPSNILMDGNWALLADFGLAKIMESSVKLTATGVGIGTPAYMSPEQGQGLDIDHRTDIYALGIILFEMLTGQRPHEADTPFGIILKRATEPLPLPRSLNPQISEAVEQVVLKALAREPENRFDSAGAMAEALNIAINETGSETSDEDLPTVLSPALITPITVEQKQEPTAEAVPLGQKIAKLLGGGPDEQRDQRNRQMMLDLVHNFWVKGVLENSLHGATLIELGLEVRPEAVDHPWQMVLQSSDLPQLAIPSGTKVIDIFNELKRSLLILGEPGSGKTTMLLELARDLISRAKQDPTQRIPVVFNLSSWPEIQPPLDEWLVKELNSKYHIPKKVAQQWLDEEALMPLLDGLDEVAQTHREACIEAINLFHKESMQPLIVCSRIADYEALTTKLGLQQAICLQALNKAQIEAYLGQFDPDLSLLKNALQNDANLQELAQSPLMLSIMSLAYTGDTEAYTGDADTELTPTDSVETQRQHLFERYVAHMLARRGTSDYSDNKTRHWLTWLAQRMNDRKQSVFHIERLQQDWLQTDKQQKVYRLSGVLFGGLIGGLLGGLFFELFFGLTFGFLFGFIERLFEILIQVLIAGSVFGLFFGLFTGLINGKKEIEPVDGLKWSAKNWLLVGLLFGLFIGLFLGPINGLGTVLMVLLFGLGVGLRRVQIELRIKPNQGINQSLKNWLISGLVFGLTGGLSMVLTAGLMGLSFGLLFGLIGWLIFGLLFGLLLGLGFGGEAVIKHYTLRLILARTGQLPYKLVPFLDDCADRIFLRKVGGGYIFVHRYLLEHFVGLSEDANTKKA